MKCPVCNTVMINGKCPECGMRIKQGKQEPIKYDTTLKRTGNYREPITSEDENKATLDKPFVQPKKYENQPRTYENPSESKYQQKEYKTNRTKKYKDLKRIKSAPILIAVIVLLSSIGKITKSIRYSDIGSVINSIEKNDIKYKFDKPDEMIEYWDKYKQGDAVSVNSQEFIFDGILGIFISEDDYKKTFIFNGNYYYPQEGDIYYNAKKNIYFSDNFVLLTGTQNNFITLS